MVGDASGLKDTGATTAEGHGGSVPEPGQDHGGDAGSGSGMAPGTGVMSVAEAVAAVTGGAGSVDGEVLASASTKRDYWLRDVEHGQCGDWEDVCRSTKANALDAISFIQTMEGALNEIHSVLQRMNILIVQKANGTYTEADIANLNKEIEALISEIDRCQDSTSFDGFHFLRFGGQTFHAPMGCPYSCHHDWMIVSMDLVHGLSGDGTVDDVRDAIAGVSAYRAMLGANQNALEHVVSVCDNLLENGFGSGIEYTEATPGNPHHLLMADKTGSQAFWTEWASMANRVRELESKKADGTLNEVDVAFIDMEIAVLDAAKDFLVDLLCEGTGAKEIVPAPSAPESELIYAVIYEDGIDGGAFGEEVHGNLAEGDLTPAFTGSTAHGGYCLAGWNTAIKKTVDAGDANDDNEIIYVARWETGPELPRTGGGGIGAYMAAGMLLIVLSGGVAVWYAARKRRDGDDPHGRDA